MKKRSIQIIPLATKLILAATSIIFMYTAGIGVFSALSQRALLLTLAAPCVFFIYRYKTNKKIINSFDYLLAALAIISGVYAIKVWPDRIFRIGTIPVMDIIMGTIMVIVILEMCRRTTGLFLTLTTTFFLFYAIYGKLFPSFIIHRGESWSRLITFLYMTTEGIFGVPMGIASTYILIFVIFGAFLQSFGGGEWFIDMAYAITGRYRGGPAKTSIVASGLMGMISGASAANVVTTGTFTIPLMKKIGYEPEDAAAIEAMASTAGLFTPPIMGAAAFIIAEYLQVSFLTVVIACILPAFLFYFSLMLSVDSKAVKHNLLGLSPSKLPDVKEVMKKGGHLCIPLVILVGGLMSGWSPMKAAFWSTILVLIVAFIKKETRPNFNKFFEALVKGSYQAIPVVSACAAAGIIVGVISITGMGAKLSYTLMSLTGGNLFMAAIVTMILAILLGCAMPPTAVYIILSAILVPPLTEMGALPISAHLFIFISSAFGAVTPPVAITAYAGAGIAEANPQKTGIRAFKLGIVGFIIPYICLYSPVLMFQEFEMLSFLMVFLSSILGIISLVAGIEGYLFVYWNKRSRIFLLFAAILLLWPGLITNIVGMLIIIFTVIFNRNSKGFKANYTS